MRARLLVGALVALSAGFTPALAQAPAQAAPNPDRTAVQTVITSFADAVQSGDMAAVEALFRARGVHILTDNATTHGWAEYRDQHLVPEMTKHDRRYAHTAVEAVVRESVAWVAFRREFGQASGMGQVEGRGTAVLEKVDGRWLIVHLHMSL